MRNFAWLALALFAFYSVVTLLCVLHLRSLHTLPGTVTRGWIVQGKGTLYNLEFVYVLNGQRHQSSDIVSDDEYARHIGPGGRIVLAPVPVFVSAAGPQESVSLRRPEYDLLAWIGPILFIPALPGICIIVWRAFVKPARAQ